jgi:hypothetical protein
MPNYYHLRTSDIAAGDGYWTITGAGTVNAALSDALDSTYVRKISTTLGIGLVQRVKDPSSITGGVSIPISGHYITSIRSLARQSQGATASTNVICYLENGTQFDVLSNSQVTTTGTLAVPATIATVSSASKAATGIITVTTAAAHGLAVNDLIVIQGSSTGTPTGHVNGSYRILTVGTTTTFTAQDVSAYSGFTASTVNATNGNISRASNTASASPSLGSLSATTGTAAQDIINRVAFGFGDNTATTLADRAFLYEAWLEVVTAALPTVSGVTVTGATTTTRPTITWTHSQADGYAQAAYRVKVFTTAQANPDTASGAAYDSGTVNSASASCQIATDLINGQSYYVYVKTRTYTGTTNDDGWSLWGSGTAGSTASFTLSLPAPTAPLVSLTYGSVQQRVRAVLTGKAVTAPMTAQTFELQRSDELGTTSATAQVGLLTARFR